MDEGSVHPISDLEPTGDQAADTALARLDAAVAAVNALDLAALVRLDSPSTGLHAVARNLELLRRRLALFDTHYVAAVEVGGEPARYAQPCTAVFLREQLRLTGGEARRRVDLAHAITPGLAFTGQVRPAARPALAAAVGAGVVSGDQARIVLETIHQLPSQVREAHGAVVEAEMVTAAAKVTPAELEALAGEVMVRADPDGVLRDVEYAHTHRGLRLAKNRGRAGGKLIAELTDETYELARVVLDARAKPVPAAPDGTPEGSPAARDARTLDERMHDAFHATLTAVLNSGDLPASGGTPAAMVWHISDDQLRDRYALAVSEHGTLLPRHRRPPLG